jgi:hypothetical protein
LFLWLAPATSSAQGTAAVIHGTANIAVFDTEIKDFETQVTDGDIGVIRGDLANTDWVASAVSKSTRVHGRAGA